MYGYPDETQLKLNAKKNREQQEMAQQSAQGPSRLYLQAMANHFSLRRAEDVLKIFFQNLPIIAWPI
jgi:hypothetical protein